MNLRRTALIATLSLSLISSVMTSTYADTGRGDEQNGGHGKIEFPLSGGTPKGLVGHRSFTDNATRTANTAGVNQYGIQYHNGAIMNSAGGVNVYIIWYGSWGADTAKTILPTFLSGLNNSPYFAINTTYADAAGTAITAKVNVLGQYSYDTNTLGTSLSDANILSLAKGSLGLGTIPSTVDSNALYFVFTAPGISESSGFLTAYCGWHSSEMMDYLNTSPLPAVAPATNMKYSFVGDPGTNNACIGQSQTTYSPNSNVGADAMASVVAHELEETVTDPDGTGWWNSTTGQENGDQCAWKFGTTSTLSTSTTLTGSVTAASNNGASNNATVTGVTNNGVLTATLSKIAGNATGTSLTFTTTAASNFTARDLVTLPANLPAPFAALSGTVQTIASVSTSNRTYTFTVAISPAVPTYANVSVTTALPVTVSKAGTTITFTNSGSNAFAVGDKVSVAAPAPYAVTNAAITARTTTSFTVSASVPASTPTVTSLSLTATALKSSTTVTFTYAPIGGAFAVGDKVSVAPSVTAYTATNASVTAVTATTFTVSLVVPAGTAPATFASVVATDNRTSGSSLYNMTLGGLKFLVQQNWANRSPRGVCALS